MGIKGSYDSSEDVPQEFKDSYSEVDGKFVLTGSIDVKNSSDYKELHKAKQASFDEMHEVKNQMKAKDDDLSKLNQEIEILKVQMKDGANPDIKDLVEKQLKVGFEERDKLIAEKDELIAEFQNTIDGSKKNEFIAGFKTNFSEKADKEISIISDGLFKKEADDIYLTVENKVLGIEAGLNKEQAVAKLNETMPHWQKQNQSDNASGGGTNSNNNENKNDNSILAQVNEAWGV